MLSKCLNCEFNVEPNARFCLNCGTDEPAKDSLFSEKRDSPRGLMLLIVFICVVLACAIRIIADESKYAEISLSYLAPALFIGLMIGAVVAVTLAPIINLKVTKKAKQVRTAEKAGKTLIGKEDEIYGKILSFSEDNIYLESLSKELGESSSGEFYTAEEENVLAKLELALPIKGFAHKIEFAHKVCRLPIKFDSCPLYVEVFSVSSESAERVKPVNTNLVFITLTSVLDRN